MECFHFKFDKVVVIVDGSKSSRIETVRTLCLKMPVLAQVTIEWLLVWVGPTVAKAIGVGPKEGKELGTGIENGEDGLLKKESLEEVDGNRIERVIGGGAKCRT